MRLEMLDRLYAWLLHGGINLLKIFVFAALLVKFVHWLNGRLLDWIRREPQSLHREQQVRTMTSILNSLGTMIIVGLALMMALEEIGLDIRPIIAGAGVAGLAVGFGAQSLVRDVINGMFILMENQYGLGDVIRAAGVQGSVEQMTLRRTVIRDNEGALHSIPNGEVRVLSNFSREWSQVMLAVPVDPRQGLERVLELLRDASQQLVADPACREDLLDAPKILGLDKLTGTQMEILLQARTRPGRRDSVSREWRKRIKLAFERAGLSLAGPQEVMMVTPPKQESTP